MRLTANDLAQSIKDCALRYGISYGIGVDAMSTLDTKKSPGEYYDFAIAKIKNGKAEKLNLDFSKKEDLDKARYIAYSRRLYKVCCDTLGAKNIYESNPNVDSFLVDIIPMMEIIKGYVNASYYTRKLNQNDIIKAVGHQNKYATKFVENLFSDRANIKVLLEYCFSDVDMQVGNIHIDDTNPNGDIVFDCRQYALKTTEKKY